MRIYRIEVFISSGTLRLGLRLVRVPIDQFCRGVVDLPWGFPRFSLWSYLHKGIPANPRQQSQYEQILPQTYSAKNVNVYIIISDRPGRPRLALFTDEPRNLLTRRIFLEDRINSGIHFHLC